MNRSYYAHFLVAIIVFFHYDLKAQNLPYLYEENGVSKVDREKYGEYIQSHPFNNRKHMSKAEMKAMDKQDRPDLAWEQEFLRSADPITGRPMSERLWPTLRIMHAKSVNVGAAPGSSSTNKWTERGPKNVGGRTRALLFDPNDNTKKKVWAGGVTGGLWYNNDITSSTSSWVAVNDFWANIAITCIAFDPVAKNTMYVGTGEGWGGGGTSSRGAGIWKTTNGGTSWTQLSSTTDFYYVNDIVVRNESGTGIVYAGVTRANYKGKYHGTKEGMYRSTNSGTSWSQVMPSTSSSGVYAPADIEIAKDNRLWVGSRNNAFGNGGGAVLFSDNGTSWTATTVVSGGQRVELACAPSDSSVVYGIVAKSSKVEEIIRTTNRGTSWLISSSSSSLTEPSDADNGIPNTDFTRGQAFYDLIAAVSPGNKDTVVVGGIDLFMSTNGGTTWKQISKWSNNNNLRSLTCSKVHADQHQLVFRPGKSNEMIVGNDGGVYYCSNLKTAETSNNFSARNTGYNVTQFYAGAIHSSAGSNSMLAGAQDNGTQRFSSAGINATTQATGGDGAFCHIDQSNPTHQSTSFVRNSIYRSTNSGVVWTRFINDLTTGSFINPSDYDDKHNILYSNKTSSTLYRFSNFTGASITTATITITGSTNDFSAITASPYSGSTSTLFLGNASGQLFKVTNASTTPIVSNINASNTVPASTISCIEIGASENELLVTLFNYGRVSVYYTSNGGTSWVNKEGNLPDMPIRWALFNPKNRKEVIVATELGIWATSDISVSSPTWAASNSGLANVRVDMLQYRSSDSLIMVSTHGRGVFTGRFKTPAASSGKPSVKFGADKTTICVGESVTFTDSSTNSPTSLLWTFTGGSPASSAASKPVVSYSTAGTYAVKLKATNASGSDSLTKTAFISVSAAPNAALGAFSALCSNSPTQTLTGGTPAGGTYFINGVVATSINPSSLSAGTYSIKYRVQVGACADSATQNITINAVPNVSATTISPVCVSNPSFTLINGTPAGGVYSGLGVSSGMFNPTAAGTGTKSIKYKVTNSNGCADSSQFSIVVNSAPTAVLTAIGPYCTNSPSDTLTNGSPVGGVYSGAGVSGNTFNPGSAMAGTHVLSYKVQLGTCSDSTTINVVVNSGPSVSATTISAVCENSLAFNLSNGSPVGGIYSGSGVTGGMFNPITAGSGTKSISYKVTSSNGCADSTAFSIVVNAKPAVSLSSVGPFCSGSIAVTLTNGTPSGGTYSGPGITGSMFDPSVAGVGSHTIKYIVTNSSGCTDSTTTSISVASGTSATLDPFSSVCADTIFTLSGGKPAGGTYSGPGVSGGLFIGGVAGPGNHTIVYTTASACGTSSDTRSIFVDSVPNVSVVKSVEGCIGESFQFNATGATNYSWSPANGLSNSTIGNPSFVVTGSFAYFLTSSHNNGCSTKDTIAVSALSTPNVIANIDLAMCIGDTFQLNANGATSYTWSPSTGLNNSTIANPQGALATSVTYIVTGKDTGKCVGIDTVNVVVKPKSVVTHNPISDVCLTSDPITLVGGTPAGGSYSGPGVSLGKFDPSVAGLGTHTITYSSSEPGKCIGNASVTINVLLSPSVVWNVPNTICENEAPLSLISSPSGGIYKGSGVSGNSFNPTTAGVGFHEITYTLTASGCLANEKREIEVVPGSIVDPIQGLNNVTKKGKYNYQVKPINGAGYLWFITGGIALSSVNNLTTVQWGNANNGKIMLVQTNSFGCTDTTELLVNVNALSIGDEVEIGAGIILYPNPADKTVLLKIDSKQNDEVQFRLFNNSGQQVLDKSSVTQNEEMFEIDIAEFPSGLYLLQAEIGNTAYSATLVIKH